MIRSRAEALALLAARKVHDVPCAYCGLPTHGMTLRRYCSARCRLRAHRLKARVRRALGEDHPFQSTLRLWIWAHRPAAS